MTITAVDATQSPATPSDQLPARPPVLRGHSHQVDTPFGAVLVTVNGTETGEAFEVFVRAGKAGSDLAGLAEAIGRLCSLCLQVPGGMSTTDRIRHIADQLGGIGGAGAPRLDAMGARSLPDAIARVLAATQPDDPPCAR